MRKNFPAVFFAMTWIPTVLLTIVLLPAKAQASPQAVGTAIPPQGASANPLPLSGRTAQSGSAKTTQQTVPGVTGSVNTINPSVLVQGPYQGSVTGAGNLPLPDGKLSMRDAIERGLRFNLGTVGQMSSVRQSEGISRSVRSALLPNLNSYTSETIQQINLQALGLGSGSLIPGLSIPNVVGPFNIFDLRATLTQTIFDRTALNNYRSAKEVVRSNQAWAEDARDIIVLAVGGAYLQVITAKARVESTRAQLETDNAIYEQTLEKRNAGLVALTDLNRSHITALTQQQRMVSIEYDLARQKINLARMIGLPVGVPFELSDDIPYSPAPPMDLDSAIQLAIEQRSDLRASDAQVRAAQRTVDAARSERLPTVTLRADGGVIGPSPAQNHGTFAVIGRVDVPIWRGGRIEADIAQAEAALAQRQAERDDLVRQIESDVRNAFLDLEAARGQADLTRTNIQVTRENLDLTRQRFNSGIGNNVEIVQSQESLAIAESDYIDSVFAHNLAKLALLRATGSGPGSLQRFLTVH